MQTAEEIAYEFIKTCGSKRVEIKHKDLTKLIKQIRSEQDKITRHACADAVLQCNECKTNDDNAIYKEDASISDSVIDRDEAHNACMNVKAV